MSVDKNYCMSSYLAFRYIEAHNKNFFEGVLYNRPQLPAIEDRIFVHTANDIDKAIQKQVDDIASKYRKIGILLSGGMDSAILASYLSGCDAYTFRFLKGDYQKEELQRAEYYAKCYNLKLHYVDIDWNIITDNLNVIMASKGGPIHSIEPQIFQGAKQAKEDSMEVVVIGDGSDYVFGGMDQLLSRDWSFDEFMKRYIYINPAEVLKEPVSMQYLFERYRQGDNIDFIGFMETIATEESYGSYSNAFSTAGMPYYDPYERLKLADPLDLSRIRRGESKYLIRELFSVKYPDVPVPEKNPMPRPVDFYFSKWEGPKRPEFKKNLDMTKFTGNQKWQLYCLEQFLNMYEPVE